MPRRRREGWLVTPDTLLRWHRRRKARRWTEPATPGPGRPRTSGEIRQLVVRMATENPIWGYRRIQGELCRLGHRIAPSTVWQILQDHHIHPAPHRAAVSWSAFLRSQAAVACDFATVDRIDAPVLRAVLHRPTSRQVFLGGTTTNPTAAWTAQSARNLLLRHAERLQQCRAFVRDGAGQFRGGFDDVFSSEGITVITTPARTPVANACAEGWVGTLRRELLDRTLIWNGRQPHPLLDEYNRHYNVHRPHRALNQQPPQPAAATGSTDPPYPSPPTVAAADSSTRTTRPPDGPRHHRQRRPADLSYGRRRPHPRLAPRVAGGGIHGRAAVPQRRREPTA